ncbi:MAG: hypothetical protein WCA00_10045 [Candidatus Acidiferrales bacterium]
MIPGSPFAESLACRALKDGLLYTSVLLAAAGSLVAFLYAVPRIVRFFDDRASAVRKQTAFSKGVKR